MRNAGDKRSYLMPLAACDGDQTPGAEGTAQQGDRVRLHFVLLQSLGWRTYSSQLQAVLASRPDVMAHVVPFRFPRPGAFFLKRHQLRPLEWLLRRRDPIAAMRGELGRELRSEIRRLRPDVVHFAAHVPGAAVAWESDRPPFTVCLDTTMRGAARDLRRGTWTERDMAREAELLGRAEHIFAASQWAARSVVEDCGVNPDRVSTMPWSVDVSRLCPARHEARSVPRIIFVGGDFARKGGPRLLRWMEGPLKGLCELHIVSGKAPTGRSIPGVVFHGEVSNDRIAAELMPEMDILCLPTLSDMSAWVVIEASGAGVPCVASDLGGIRELLKDRESGRLVAADDDAAFVSALKDLIANPELRQSYGRRARAMIVETFDARKNYNALIDRMKAIGEQRRHSRVPPFDDGEPRSADKGPGVGAAPQ